MKKKQTIFVNLEGKLARYVGRIYTEAKTKNKNLQALQTRLNVIINDYTNKPATADNCRTLWDNLTSIVKSFRPTDKTDPVYSEIVDAVDTIGYSIAYLCKRSGYEPNQTMDNNGRVAVVNIYPNQSDEQKINLVKIQILNDFWTGYLTKEKAENAKVLYYTDEHLLELAERFSPYKDIIEGFKQTRQTADDDLFNFF